MKLIDIVLGLVALFVLLMFIVFWGPVFIAMDCWTYLKTGKWTNERDLPSETTPASASTVLR